MDGWMARQIERQERNTDCIVQMFLFIVCSFFTGVRKEGTMNSLLSFKSKFPCLKCFL